MKDYFNHIIEKKRIIIFTVAVLSFFAVVFLTLFLLRDSGSIETKEEKDPLAEEDSITRKEKKVRGNSLSGLLENGETVSALLGYYNYQETQRGDLILYSYAGNDVPLIKIVKGISGDKFKLKEVDAGRTWHILINGEITKNSQDNPYLLDVRGHRILSLFEEGYEGIIPANAYLILGNLVSGAIDSTHFGLVHRDDILGKVLMKNNKKQ